MLKSIKNYFPNKTDDEKRDFFQKRNIYLLNFSNLNKKKLNCVVNMVPRFENCDKKRVKKTSLFEEKRYHNLTTKKHLKELTKNKLFSSLLLVDGVGMETVSLLKKKKKIQSDVLWDFVDCMN